MNDDRIDFISAYCDRWCERCAFASRCSLYATEAAIAMCGDTREGLELAVGLPHPEDNSEPERPEWHKYLDEINKPLTPEEEAEYDRLDKERHARVRATPIAALSHTYSMLAHKWTLDRADALIAGADEVLREALEIVCWDALRVHVKVMRALDGRDRYQHDEDFDDDPVQNDWNGSAKVALIAVERSADAWRVIADAAREPIAATFADQLSDLQRQIEAEFPKAWEFVRPGFDEPGR